MQCLSQMGIFLKVLIIQVVLITSTNLTVNANIPPDYKGKPYYDDTLGFKGPQVIPGRIELAYYDFGSVL